MGVSRVRIRLTHSIDERFVRQSFSLMTSVLIHAGVVLFSFVASTPEAGEFRSTRRASSISLDAKPRQRLIWIRKSDRLPAVSPGDPGPLRADRNQTSSNQARRAAPAKAKSNKQFVWSDIPQATPQPVVQSADLVSLAAPRAAIPDPPPQRETRRFALPAATRKPAETKLVDDLALNLPNPASPQSLNAPSVRVDPGTISKPPARAFSPPPDSPRRPATGLVEAPDVPAVQGGNGAVNLVVLSQTPGSGLPSPGLSPRSDRVGSVPGNPSSTPGGGGTEGLTVPGVTVRGSAGAAPAGTGTVRASTQPVDPAAASASTAMSRPSLPSTFATTVSVPQWPHARRVPVEVDRMFPTKPVFTAMIAGSAGGPDWILWFSDKEEIARGTRVLMRPPMLQRRQGPDAGLHIAGLPPRVLISGSISREGRFLVRGVSQDVPPELARQLAQEAAQWSFSAAYRNGLAIEADCLLEMRVNPRR